jgi:hypothetical protein
MDSEVLFLNSKQLLLNKKKKQLFHKVNTTYTNKIPIHEEPFFTFLKKVSTFLFSKIKLFFNSIMS